MASQFHVKGKIIEIVFEYLNKTEINSYNYFTNGIISTNYFIVEGYKKNNEK